MKRLAAFGALYILTAVALISAKLDYQQIREIQKIANAAKVNANLKTDTLGFRVDTLEDSINFLLAYVDTLKDINDSLGGITIPKGFIGIWGGDTLNIPAGWSLCDGDTFTVWDGDTIWEPDLRDRFVVSYGSKFAVNDTGGIDSLAATGTTDAGSAHTHTINGLVADSTVRYPGSGTKIYIGRLSTGTTLPTNANESAHTHTFTATKQRSLPPYYALCYIFKL